MTRWIATLGAFGFFVPACALIGGIEEAKPQCPVDGRQNGLETDVDCGGPCEGCAGGASCQQASDCLSSSCDDSICGSGATGACADDLKNGTESDVDCGDAEGVCPSCAGGQLCNAWQDCASKQTQGDTACFRDNGTSEQGVCLSICCSGECDNCTERCNNECCNDAQPDAACCPELCN